MNTRIRVPARSGGASQRWLAANYAANRLEWGFFLPSRRMYDLR